MFGMTTFSADLNNQKSNLFEKMTFDCKIRLWKKDGTQNVHASSQRNF